MNKLKKQMIYELIITFGCIFIIGLYIATFISSKFYFSNFLLSTTQVIFTGVIMIFMLQRYFHDLNMLEMLEENDKKGYIIIDITNSFWHYCFMVFTIICITSIAGFSVLLSLDIFLNITSYINIITIILTLIATISTVIIFTIIIINERTKKHI